jgi:hypothetical protein
VVKAPRSGSSGQKGDRSASEVGSLGTEYDEKGLNGVGEAVVSELDWIIIQDGIIEQNKTSKKPV